MEVYPTIMPLPLLKSGSSSEGSSFIRTQFDYGIRQTRKPRGYATQSFSIFLDHYLLDEWETFWIAINYGTDPFNCSFMVHGSTNVDKVIRFTNSYTLKMLAPTKFELSCSIEILGAGTALFACPLVPSDTLTPSSTLTPC